MARPVEIKLLSAPALDRQAPAGFVRMGVDLPVLDQVLRIDVEVPDRRTRLIDIIPVAREICEQIAGVAVAWTQRRGKPVSCRKGCGACCGVFLVGMSEPEAFCLIEDLKRLSDRRRNRILGGFLELGRIAEQSGLYEALDTAANGGEDAAEAFQIFHKWWRQVHRDCPMLVDNACSLYPCRPMACREFYVTSDPALCASFQGDRVYVPVRMYWALARLAGELEGTKPNLVMLPALLRWYAGKATRAECTWRGPMMVRRFLDMLRETAEAAAARPAPAAAGDPTPAQVV